MHEGILNNKIVLDRLTTLILKTGFNKRIQSDDLGQIMESAECEVNASSLQVLQNWALQLEKVHDNPLLNRRDLAVNELIESGVSKEDAAFAVNRVAGMTSDLVSDFDANKKQGSINELLILPKIMEFPSINLNQNPIIEPIATLRITNIGTGLVIGRIQNNFKWISLSIIDFSVKANETIEVQLILSKNAPNNLSKYVINQAITVEWSDGKQDVDCEFSVISSKNKKNNWWIALIILIFAILIAIANNQVPNSNQLGTQNLPAETIYTTNKQNAGIVKEVIIKANEEWQNTGVEIRQGQDVKITYISGMWEIMPDSMGYPFIEYGAGGAFLDVGWIASIGRIENQIPFSVGESYEFTANNSGTLFLRANDSDMGDNSGSIIYKIEVH